MSMILSTNQVGYNIEFLNGAAGWKAVAGPYPDKPTAKKAMDSICAAGEYRVYPALTGHFCAGTGANNEPSTENKTV